jgi:hypothetical protein
VDVERKWYVIGFILPSVFDVLLCFRFFCSVSLSFKPVCHGPMNKHALA